MPRGRRPKPAEVKLLLGNPGKGRLAALTAAAGRSLQAPAPAPPSPEPPAFLVTEAEKHAFAEVMRVMPPNLVRQSDAIAFGRWAAWLCIWVNCKLQLDGKKHWTTTETRNSGEVHREHPVAKRMDRAETLLMALEDRLCLNIVSRNNVMHRLFNMPTHPSGGLFGVEPSEADKHPSGEPALGEPEQPDLDPSGFILRAGKQHSTH